MKRCAIPCCGSLFPGVAQPAQFLDVHVGFVSLKQCLLQAIPIELGIVPGTRDRPHVYQSLYPVSLEHLDKRVDTSGRAPNREDHCRGLRHLTFPAPATSGAAYAFGRPIRVQKSNCEFKRAIV